MMIRFALAALLLLPQQLAAQVAAVPPPAAAAPTAPVAAPKPVTVRVSLQTSQGPIVLELEKERAPITTANFLKYVDGKRLDGTTIYRAAKVADGFGLVQGGVRYDPKKILKNIPHEPTTVTGLSHTDGAISMARAEPGTANGDFFITVGAMTSMDADPKAAGDNQGFAVFGHVVEGMDIVRGMLELPKSPTEGEGVMKGQMLAPPVKIISARRVK